jgi:hypothetical protein
MLPSRRRMTRSHLLDTVHRDDRRHPEAVAEFQQEVDDLGARGGVEVSCRLVGRAARLGR